MATENYKSFKDFGKANKRKHRAVKNYVDPDQTGTDGVDHINVSRQATSDLGRALRLEAGEVPFRHPTFGRFRTMTGFWYYMKTGCIADRLRSCHAGEVNYIARRLETKKVDNFYFLIAEAYYYKIVNNASLLKMIRNSAAELPAGEDGNPQYQILPFEMWYLDTVTGHRRRPSYHESITEALEKIRTHILLADANNEPIDTNKCGIFDYMLTTDKNGNTIDPYAVYMAPKQSSGNTGGLNKHGMVAEEGDDVPSEPDLAANVTTMQDDEQEGIERQLDDGYGVEVEHEVDEVDCIEVEHQ